MRLNKIVIGVGSNVDPEKNIEEAKNAIVNQHNLIKASSFIETTPIGCKD